MKRRTFLRGAAVVGSAALAKPLCSLSTGPLATQEATGVQRTTPFGKNGIMIPDEGWRMWPDTSAPWEKDEIFLPDEVELQTLPTNPPSGGWDVLNDQLGTVLTLVFASSDPSGVNLRIADFTAPTFQQDHFTYLLREGFSTEALTKEGKWRFRLHLEDHPTPTFERELLVVAPTPRNFRPIKVGIASLAPTMDAQLRLIPYLQIESFTPGQKYDVILASGGSLDAERNLAVDAEGAYKPRPGPIKEFTLPNEVLEAVKQGTPLLACTPSEGQAIGVAKQLAQAGAFRFNGMVGPSRASWMGSWYFVREHALYDGLPANQAMSIHYQVKGGGSNGWIVEGENVEIVAAYSRDHDRKIGAGTLTTKLNGTPIVMHQITDMQPVLHRRFLANSLAWLTRL